MDWDPRSLGAIVNRSVCGDRGNLEKTAGSPDHLSGGSGDASLLGG